jgi:hypothetical protein
MKRQTVLESIRDLGEREDILDAASIEKRKIEGLKLSPLQYQPLDFFKASKANAIFDRLKTPDYWRDLKRDIDEARAIIDPVICLQDGTILEGHSRIKIARELDDEKRGLGKIPVLLVTSPISDAEAERRILLGNLSRFEIDEDTRQEMYAKLWPGWYRTDNQQMTERLGGGDMVSPLPPTRAEMARETGKSERQIKRDAAVMREAEEIARQHGRATPSSEDIRAARARSSAKRRKPLPSIVRISHSTAVALLSVIKGNEIPTAQKHAAISELSRAIKGRT